MESKEIYLTQLLKPLDPITLKSDSLQDLETFYYVIHSHFATIMLTNNHYPKTKDLQKDFSLYEKFCSPKCNTTLSQV